MITQEKIDEFNRECSIGMARLKVVGPWKTEPHRVDFEHAGFHCLALRQPVLLHWCGYVGVPPSHPLYGKSYNDVQVSAHGGLTFSNHCHGDVCHIASGEDKLYWFGFDCAHLGDLSPGMTKHSLHYMDESYRDIEWVKRSICQLAEELRAWA